MVGKVPAQQPQQQQNTGASISTATRSVAAGDMNQASTSSDSDDDIGGEFLIQSNTQKHQKLQEDDNSAVFETVEAVVDGRQKNSEAVEAKVGLDVNRKKHDRGRGNSVSDGGRGSRNEQVRSQISATTVSPSNGQLENSYLRGLKQKEKSDPDEEEKKSKEVTAVSSDDEEANEDLSLKIVEKHLLMRAAKLVQNDGDDDNDVILYDEKKVDLSSSSVLEPGVVTAGPSRTNDKTVIEDVKSDNKRTRVRKKKKKIEMMEIGDQSVIVKEVHVKTVENGEEAVKASDISDNIVLRKLLRGPRYFDPPDSGWQTCYNCGEEGHMAVNCSSAKRKKPCFICGSLDHGVKQCSKAQDCFICKKVGHRAKDCPEKYKSGSQNAKVCLKCGDYGHDMFSCRNNYSLDDLKEIQCYICKSYGHLCCVNITDNRSREVSCFKCGHSGHTGLACNRLRGETTDTASPSSCFKCGGEGHFARECVSSAKIRRKNFDSSTPTLRPHRENKDYSGYKSAPNDHGKGHKKRKTQNEDIGITTPQKSKHRGGWITEDPGERSSYSETKRSRWKSPATPTSKGHKISAVTAGGHISSSRSFKNKSVHHHRFAASRFDNSGNNGFRNYDWW
ncbi:zinc finger CCHC domain-containing protein 7-like [Pistacia vera]|uniref:zinc finger CCHC domain-containing protein 7-like n=1 Tax=Pistacia vera TaxID=55513 RepID=UPI0012639CC6|nr:zinc finger CCHC domain-containing protein 7-like [Pistacia vera]